jgi:uncharacterized protein (DUF1499 family)
MNKLQFTPIICMLVTLAACTSAPIQPNNGGNLSPCGSFPNCVISLDYNSRSYIKPLAANSQQWQALKQILSQRDGWQITISKDLFVQAVVTTPAMRFKDDVQLQFVSAKDIIHIRSSSRLGYSDMGTNAARVKRLRKIIRTL